MPINPCVFCGNEISTVDPLGAYRFSSDKKGVCRPCSLVIKYLESDPAAAKKIMVGTYDPELDGPEVVYIRYPERPFKNKELCQYWERRATDHINHAVYVLASGSYWYDQALLAEYERGTMP